MVLVSTFLVLRLSKKHTDNYTNPIFQRKIIVIIYIIPFYGINSMLTTLLVTSERWLQTFAIIRGLYEAVLVLSFFQLIVAFLCWRDNVP